METGSKDRREEAAAELLLLARKLEDMQEGPMTQEAEDRIFAKIEASLDEELAPQAARPSRIRTGLSALGAYMPRPLIQRRADALAMMVEDVRARRSVAARGELGAMLAAVGALQPLPTIEPNPSFVDWLEVRLASAHAEVPTASRLAERIAALNSTLRNWRLQAGLASAAASVIAVAIFALQGGQAPVTRDPSPVGPIAAPPTLPITGTPETQPSSAVAQSPAAPRGPLTSPGGGSSTGGDGGGSGAFSPSETQSNEGVFGTAGASEDEPKQIIRRALDGLVPN